MLYLCVYCSHPTRGWSFFLQATETCPHSEKNFANRQGLENAENSCCSSSTGFGPTLTTMAKLFASQPTILTKVSASFTANVCTVSSLFSGQLRSRILRCPQIVVLFAVLFVDFEECLSLLVWFLPGARHAIVCILFSLEQSRVVD